MRIRERLAVERSGVYFFRMYAYSFAGHSMSQVEQFLLKNLAFFRIQPHFSQVFLVFECVR